MSAPNKDTIDRLRTAALAMQSASSPLDRDDPIREKIEDAAGHVEHIIGELKRLRDNTQ